MIKLKTLFTKHKMNIVYGVIAVAIIYVIIALVSGNVADPIVNQ